MPVSRRVGVSPERTRPNSSEFALENSGLISKCHREAKLESLHDRGARNRRHQPRTVLERCVKALSRHPDDRGLMKLLGGVGPVIPPNRIEIAIRDGGKFRAKPHESRRRVVVAEPARRSRSATLSRARETLEEERERPERRGHVERGVGPPERVGAGAVVEPGGRDGEPGLERPEALVQKVENARFQAVAQDAQGIRLHVAPVVFPAHVVVLSVVARTPAARVEAPPLFAHEAGPPVRIPRDAVRREESPDERLVREAKVARNLSDADGADRGCDGGPSLFEPDRAVVIGAKAPLATAHFGLRGEIPARPIRLESAIEKLREAILPVRNRLVVVKDRFKTEFRQGGFRFRRRVLCPRGGNGADGEDRQEERTSPQDNSYITNPSVHVFPRRTSLSLPSISKSRFTSSASRTASRSSCRRSAEFPS